MKPVTKKERIDFLQNIQKGWYDGVGEPVHPEVIHHLLETEELPMGWAFAYPTLEGNVNLEWDSEHSSNFPEEINFIEVEVSPSKASLFYGKTGNEGKEIELPLDGWVNYILNLLAKHGC